MFKVGDKVRIIGNGYASLGTGINHGHEIGEIGVVTIVYEQNRSEVKVGRLSQTLSNHHLELVQRKERKPKNIKSPKDVIAHQITLEQAMKDDILLMAHLYHKGLSFRDVAKLTGVNERTVRRRFKKYGVPSRGKGDS